MPKTLKKEAKSGPEAIEVIRKFLSKKNRSKYIAIDNAKLIKVQAIPGKVSVECVYTWDPAIGGSVKITAGGQVLVDKAFQITPQQNAQEMNDIFSEFNL
jgi:hypothetical protein